ncbi:MAG: class I SAM-dependent methyltransferase [Phycisphaerae bacterium]
MAYSPADWARLYQENDPEQLPWFCTELDQDIDKSLRLMKLRKANILDIGSGPGTQTIALADLGHNVLGLDISPAAVRKARRRASQAGVTAKFTAGDITTFAHRQPFDAIIDRGCFHALPANYRMRYLVRVAQLLKPNGWLFLKTFSSREPRSDGPARFKASEIRLIFRPFFRWEASWGSVFSGTLQTYPKALVCLLRRKDDVVPIEPPARAAKRPVTRTLKKPATPKIKRPRRLS